MTLGEAITGIRELLKCHRSPFLCSVFESFSLPFNSTALLQPSLHLWTPKHFPKRQPPKPQTSTYTESGRWNIAWFTPSPPAFPHLARTALCGRALWWCWLFCPTHTQAVKTRVEERCLSQENQSPTEVRAYLKSLFFGLSKAIFS